LERTLVRRSTLTSVGVACVIATLAGQTTESPAFEIASIKPANQPPRGSPGPAPPDRFIRRYTTLSLLLAYAHEVSALQIEGAPEWAFDTFFDVEAKADFRPTPEEMRMMVRRLLSERFSLKTHLETKERPRYRLVKARSDGRLGDRLRQSAVDCPAVIAARGPGYKPSPVTFDAKGFPRPPQPGEPPSCAIMTRGTSCSVTLLLEGTPIPQFARLLQGQAGRVVIDNTALTGTYDIEFETVRPNVSVQSDQCDAPSLFAALEEQLGLKLESDEGPVEMLVIDAVSKPTPD
jgi:uncharacterized protein (TIGR03435 family)